MSKPLTTVCAFGNYNKAYSRNRVLLKGLEKNDVSVIHVNSSISFFSRQFRLIKLFFAVRNEFQIFLIFHTGRTDIPLAFALAKLFNKKIVFDAFFSGYNTMVETRKVCKKGSLKAKLYWFSDKICCFLSDIVLLDTNTHIEYFRDVLKVSPKKLRRVFIGSDEDVFKKVDNSGFPAKFTVWWHGTFIPGHGVEVILQAAKLLENHSNLKFVLCGQGQLHNTMLNLSKSLALKNTSFIPLGTYEELAVSMSSADICLGVFDNTVPKYTWVIPNKCFEAIALGKPLITGECSGIKEAFCHGENASLCEMSCPKSLASAIADLTKNKDLYNKISKNGNILFKEKFTSLCIGEELKKILIEIA